MINLLIINSIYMNCCMKSLKFTSCMKPVTEIICIRSGQIENFIVKEIQKKNFIRFWVKTCGRYTIQQEDRGTKFGILQNQQFNCGILPINAGADAVDYKLISICHKGDIVVSQDYGVAAMALGKGAYAIHQSGKWYTDENIDQMLMERHLNKKARRGSHKNHIKGPRKRTEEDDVRFTQSFEKMIQTIIQVR